MIEKIFILLIWLVMPLFCHYLLKLAGLRLSRVTIPTFLILFFYLYQYAGFPLLYFQLDTFRAQLVTNQYLITKVFIFTSITITLMIVGFIIGEKHFGKLTWASMNNNFINSTKKVTNGGERQNFGLGVLTLVCVAVLFSYLSIVGTNNLAIMVALEFSDDLSSETARSLMTNSFTGKYHWYKLFMDDLMRFSLFALLAQSMIRKTFLTRTLIFPLLFITIFSMVMSTQKAPLINLFIGLFMVSVLVRDGGDFSFYKLIFLGTISLSTLTIFYITFMGFSSPLEGFIATLSRALTGQMEPAYHYLSMFPDHQEFLLGRSFPNPRGILPFEHYRLTVEVMAWFNPHQYKNDVVGSMPTVYWGEMYANFGFIGVLIAPFFVGYLLYGINSFIFQLQKNPLSIALVVWLSLHFSNLSGTSLSNYLLDLYLVGIIVCFFVLSLFSGNGKIYFIKKLFKI